MKAEKLKSLLTKLQDGERKSKLRNDNLLGDFGKVSEMASDLERKADKLRNVKVMPVCSKGLSGGRV